MVPLHKLRQLPRRQRLRKIAKLMDEADRCAAGRAPSPVNLCTYLEYLANLSTLLCEDEELSPEQKAAIARSRDELIEAHLSFAKAVPRRPVNVLRHLLAQEVGKQAADWDFIDAAGSLSASDRLVFAGVTVFLEDIRSPFNVGSMFRTAEAFGVEHMFLSELCASPGHVRAERSAMGCTGLVAWEHRPLGSPVGPVFALETGGTPLCEFPFPNQGMMIVGSEELGVSPEALALADASLGRVSIPMFGAKGSLNVAVAFGIAMQAWASSLAASRQNR